MATITALGTGSGLDLEAIISKFMQVERQPLQAISTQKSAFQSKISAFGTVKSALTTFQSSVSALSSASKFNAQKATSSDESIFKATTDGSATVGSFDLTVSQLAKSQKLASSGFASSSTTVGTGTLTISFGTYTPDDGDSLTTGDNTFTANPDKSDLTITIDSSNNTLSGIRDAINAADGDVTATIVNNGSTSQLVVTSKDSGEVNTLKISVDDDDGNDTNTSGLSQLAYDPTASASSGKNMSEIQAAKNALLTIDGISIEKSSNVIEDAVDGLTLTLLKTTDVGETVSLDIESDIDTIKASVQSFVDAYNKLNSTFKDLTKFNEDDKTKNGKLIGDATLRTISFQIKQVLTNSIGSGSLSTLSDVGVSFDDGGNLTLDTDKLSEVIESDFSGIAKLFSANATFTDSQIKFVGSTTATKEGTYAINVTSIGSSSANFVGTINGVGATGSKTTLKGAPNDDSEGLEIEISGSATGSRGTVTFTKGFAALLDELISDYLDSEDGLIATKTDGFEASIDTLDEKTERLETRLTVIEARYRAQYARLDTVLSNMSSISTYLSQQLS
jgi:flagellar hook-associated protein 2